MARVPRNGLIYDVADQFRERCLTGSLSLLWPDQQVWTVENLTSFWEAFVGHPDTRDKSFIEKWAEQLETQSDDVIRVAADVTAFYCLFPSTKSLGTAAKKGLVEQVMALRSSLSGAGPLAWSAIMDAFRQEGVGSTGTYYNTGRPFQIAFYLGFALHVKTQGTDLADWKACRDAADQVRDRVKKEAGQTPSLGRNIILHLLFPDYFEDTASDDQKRRMFDAFREDSGVSPDTDVDEGVYQIRQQFTNKYGSGFSFYDPEIRERWDSSYRLKRGSATPKPADSSPHVSEDISTSIEHLAGVVHLRAESLREIEDLLHTKRQLIFEGPPGSGKTYVAEKFARWFTGQPLDGAPLDKHVEIVQFHQSYGYEDFVQGIRPTTVDGKLIYEIRDGIFLDMVERAKANPDDRFVLIIDEINRGNLSRIFGELLLLLEYRGQSVRLPYGSGDAAYLTIPENLYIIGTMNTADRSLAQIDYALRRRFYFVRFMPVANGHAEVYENWLAHNVQNAADRDRLASLFVALNHGIGHHLGTDDLQVGHSYFMQEGIETDIVFDRVWNRAVRPLLEEYLHHHRQRDEILTDLTPARLLPTSSGMAVEDMSEVADAVEPGQV